MENRKIARFGLCIWTENFVSKEAALRYYGAQGNVAMEDIEKKVSDGSIKIGKPELKEGESLLLLDGGARYGIGISGN